MKKILNVTAIKKNLNKQSLNYYIDNKNVIAWNKQCTFAIFCNELLFNEEIKNNIPTNQFTELPPALETILENYENSELIIHTLITYKLNNCDAYLFQNMKYKYLTPVNTELLKIMNNIADFTAWQYKKNTGVLFKNDFLKIIIFPLFDGDIKNKIIDLGNMLQ